MAVFCVTHCGPVLRSALVCGVALLSSGGRAVTGSVRREADSHVLFFFPISVVRYQGPGLLSTMVCFNDIVFFFLIYKQYKKIVCL